MNNQPTKLSPTLRLGLILTGLLIAAVCLSGAYGILHHTRPDLWLSARILAGVVGGFGAWFGVVFVLMGAIGRE